MITGKELYELIQVQVAVHGFWCPWDSLHPESQQGMDKVAEILNERTAEQVYAETAGEDI